MIYLDYNATTPTDPAVVDAMLPYLRELHGNPSSHHAMGRRIRQGIENARTEVAALINSSPDEIVLMSGGTEANNHVVKGLAFARAAGGSIVTSAVEHPSVALACRFLERFGIQVIQVGVDRSGRVDPESVRRALRPDTFLVTIMLANNEVGTIQPIAEIARVAHAARVLVHTDAAQAVGKIPVDVKALDVDFLTVAGHKFYAPPGVGALYVRDGQKFESLLHGAGHERGRRAGTEAVPNIIGLGAAAVLARKHLGDERIRDLRDRLHRGLTAELGERVVLNGHPELRLPNTLNIGFRGLLGTDLLAAMDGIAASQGSACHFDQHEPSAVLTAMGVERSVGLGSIRFSVGRYTTEAEIDEAVQRIVGAYRSLGRR
ncbi:MAG TPA: cysteine desulfurase family protein [Phycisphaerae bacterium]|jgi:cysteine desulfurase